MAAQVVSLFKSFQRPNAWTQKELAEFYRVESALIQAGLQLETEQGVSDEGDPWFVFCRADNGEVFIHFARIDGQYIAVGAALDQVVRGRDFSALVQEMLAAQAWVMAKARNQSNVFLHPAALLIALVGASFFHSSEAKAAEQGGHEAPVLRRHALPILIQDDGGQTPTLDTTAAATIVSSVLIGLNELAPQNTTLSDWSLSSDLNTVDHFATPLVLDAAALPLPTLPPVHTNAGLPATTLSVTSSEALLPHPSSSSNLEGVSIVSGGLPIPPDHIAALPSSPAIHAATVAHLDIAAPVSMTVATLLSSTGDAAQAIQFANILGFLSPQLSVTLPTHSGSDDDGSASQSPSGDPSGSVGSSLPSGPAHVGDSAPGVALPPPAASSQPTTPIVETGLLANSPVATGAISHFATEVTNLDIASTGSHITLYDGAVYNGHAPIGQADVVTLDFVDGSSITLIGTVSEIQNLHLSLT